HRRVAAGARRLNEARDAEIDLVRISGRDCDRIAHRHPWHQEDLRGVGADACWGVNGDGPRTKCAADAGYAADVRLNALAGNSRSTAIRARGMELENSDVTALRIG